MQAKDKSQSSSAMNADSPPSSRNTFFTVSLAAAMIRRPVAVDPVKLTMSTIGSVVSASATLDRTGRDHADDTGRDVRFLAENAGERLRRPRRVGRALDDDRASGSQRGHELRQRDLQRVVVGHDRGDDADRLLLDPTVVRRAVRLGRSEIFLSILELVEQLGVPADDADGSLELRAMGECERRTDVGHDHAAQILGVTYERLVQLAEAAGAANA